MIGGITTDGEYHYIIRPTTNSDNVLQFMKFLSTSTDLDGAVILMDNHAAHHSNVVKEFCDEEKLFRLFQPPSSSEFNPVEKLWAVLKKRWREEITKRDPLLRTNTGWMQTQIIAICSEVTKDKVIRLSRAHYQYMQNFLP